MLKLEKKSRDREVHIHMRAKQCVWSPTLKQAFGIALGMHFFAFVLFHVSPFRLSYESILPPTSVEAEIAEMNDESDQLIVSQIDGDENKTHFTLNLSSTVPDIPSLPKVTFLQDDESVQSKDPLVAQNLFALVESDIKEHYFSSSVPSEELIPVVINVSGKIAEKPAPQFSVLPRISSNSVQRLIYAVQVENRTGKIFYFSLKEAAVPAQTQMIAESIIREINFEPEPTSNDFITSGEVEIIFNHVRPIS